MPYLIQNDSIIKLAPFELTIDVNYAGVLTTFTYPAGTVFDSVEDISTGSMSLLGDEWTIPNYVKNSVASITINVKIDDVSVFGALAEEDRIVVGDTTDLTGEIQLIDNVTLKLIEGITCVDINDCVNQDLEEFASMSDAITALGDGKEFLAALVNLHGWSYRAKLVTPFP